jgi:hypothetical protein
LPFRDKPQLVQNSEALHGPVSGYLGQRQAESGVNPWGWTRFSQQRSGDQSLSFTLLSFSSICASFSFRLVPPNYIYGVDREHLLAGWAGPSETKNWIKSLL